MIAQDKNLLLFNQCFLLHSINLSHGDFMEMEIFVILAFIDKVVWCKFVVYQEGLTLSHLLDPFLTHLQQTAFENIASNFSFCHNDKLLKMCSELFSVIKLLVKEVPYFCQYVFKFECCRLDCLHVGKGFKIPVL